jgi:hypothetical protein
MDHLQTLWQAHLAAGFPRLEGTVVRGVDLAELDAAVAGCVSTYLDERLLDTQRVEVLKRCRRDLLLVTLAFQDDERAYFLRLYGMTRLVLDKITNGEA